MEHREEGAYGQLVVARHLYSTNDDNSRRKKLFRKDELVPDGSNSPVAVNGKRTARSSARTVARNSRPVSADSTPRSGGRTLEPRFYTRSRAGGEGVTSRRATLIPVSFRGLPLPPPQQSGSLIVAQGGARRGGERNASYDDKGRGSPRGTRSAPRRQRVASVTVKYVTVGVPLR